MRERTTRHISRRTLMRMSALTLGACVASDMVPAGIWAAPLRASDLTPAEALASLYEGNRRFAQGRPLAPNRTLDRLRAVAPKQEPFAAILGCADSRVPTEVVFDQGFGDLFVVRVAGNVVDPSIIGSLEFGTEVIGARVLYVLGHTGCGAVSAAMAGQAVPGQISTLFQHIVPAVKVGGGTTDGVVAANVRLQAELLAEASPVIKALVKAGRLQVAGGVYDLRTGVVTPVALGVA